MKQSQQDNPVLEGAESHFTRLGVSCVETLAYDATSETFIGQRIHRNSGGVWFSTYSRSNGIKSYTAKSTARLIKRIEEAGHEFDYDRGDLYMVPVYGEILVALGTAL